jgi:hypothetical protein
MQNLILHKFKNLISSIIIKYKKIVTQKKVHATKRT